MAIDKQTTLNAPVEFSGIGLHTGAQVVMRIEPAGDDTGLVFVSSGRRISATIANAVESARNTVLTDGVVSLHTVEHVLSALYGMGVDNAEIMLEGPEPPALDGSSGPLAAAIAESGLRMLDSDRKVLALAAPVEIESGRSRVAAVPNDRFEVSYILEYDHPMIGRQEAFFSGNPADYPAQVAPARTFGLFEEVRELRNSGLALGGSKDNAIVVYNDTISAPLRLDNEFARHKLLDLVGDLALLGCRIRARVEGVRSGHALNVRFVRKLIEFSEIH